METNLFLWLAFWGLVIGGNISAVWLGTKKNKFMYVPRILAACLVIFLLSGSTNWWQFLVASPMVYLASGAHTYSVVSQNYRLSRFLYYLCLDIPVSILFFLVLMPGYKSFWFLPLFVILFFLLYGLFSAIASRLFPVVHLQEQRYILLLIKNKQKANELTTKINQLEYKELVKKTWEKLDYHKNVIDTVKNALPRKTPPSDHLSEVISDLEAVRLDLQTVQQDLLGQAYQLRARILCRQADFSQADADLNRSYQLVNIDETSLGELVESFIDGRNYGSSLFNHCLRYLGFRKGKKKEARDKKVLDFMEAFVVVHHGSTPAKYSEIVENCKKVIQLYSGFWWAHASLGQAYFYLQNYQQALVELETASQLNKKDVNTLTCLGKCYQKLNRLTEARKAYERSLALHENQPGVAHELGVFWLNGIAGTGTADPAMAFRWLEQAVRLKPQNALYQSDFAQAAVATGNLQAAKVAVQKALSLDPSLKNAHRILAEILFDEENWKAALSHLLELKDSKYFSYSSVQVRLGRCYAENRQWNEALRVLEPIWKTEPLSCYPLGRAYLVKQQYDKAVEYLHMAIKNDEKNLTAWYALGCALVWQNKIKKFDTVKEAQGCFTRVIEAKHRLTPRAQLQQGHLAMADKDIEKAINLYLLAYQSQELKKEAGLALVKAYIAQNQPDKASRIQKEIENLTKDDPQAHFIFGIEAEMRKDYAQAIKEYRTAQAHGALGVVLSLSGQHNEAKLELNLAKSEGDRSDRILYYSGLSNCQIGDYPQVIQDWQELFARHTDDNHLELNIARVWYMTGVEEYRKNMFQKAAEAWENFYKVYSTDEDIREKLQTLYLRISFEKIGESESEKALAKARQYGASQENGLFLEALNAFRKKEFTRASGLLQKLIELFPNNPSYLYNLGLCHLINNSHEEAQKNLDLAHQLSHDHLREQISLGLAALSARKGDWERVAVLTGIAG